jgi:hypothetical protein
MSRGWMSDLRKHIESFPFGEVSFSVRRVGGKTVAIKAETVETARFETNEEVVGEITRLFQQLEELKYDGSVTISVEFKGGKTKEVAYYSVKQTSY